MQTISEIDKTNNKENVEFLNMYSISIGKSIKY